MKCSARTISRAIGRPSRICGTWASCSVLIGHWLERVRLSPRAATPCPRNLCWWICRLRAMLSRKFLAAARPTTSSLTFSPNFASANEHGLAVKDHFDVIVVGAGHAGCEAAFAAARLGLHVGLCTLSRETVGHMPCNPAIGGTAKGHLVREIDALGGLMGRAIDATGIQFKLLNRSRGPAVWSPRAQADKKIYGRWVKRALDAEPNIEWLIGKAGRILVENDRVVGLVLEDGDAYACDGL